MTQSDGGVGALDGITVLDLSGPEAQPCSRLLADLGADVILIEPPAGSPSRRIAPFANPAANDSPGPDDSLYFVLFNANKRGIVLDLESEDGRARFRDLVKSADVVLESGAPGRMDSLGLGYEALAEINPGIVMTSVTPFGQTGPYRNFRGADIAITSMGGTIYSEGEPEGPPTTMPRYQSYQMGSIHAAFGTLIALRHRRASGRGQRLDISMVEALAHMNMNLVRYSSMTDVAPRRGSRGSNGPTQYFQTADNQWVQLALTTPRQWQALATWIDDPELLEPRLQELSARDGMSDMINAKAAVFIRKRTAEEYLRVGSEKHVTVAPANSPRDLAEHPHAVAYDFLTPLKHPVHGEIKMPAGPAVYHGTPLSLRRPAPMLGQHTAEVLSEAAARRPAERSIAGTRANGGGSESESQPLAGLRILAFERVWAAPFGTRFLADYGADVVKVESTRFPDGRVFDREANPVAWRNTNASYGENNRNKRSIALDLHMPEGQELFKRLAGEADVVVENNAPGAMERFGIAYEALREVNPNIIMVSCPGYGSAGPMKDFVAVGQCLTSFTGLGYLWAQPGSQWPARAKNAYPDFITAGNLAVAIMAAVHHRDRTGEGQFVEIPQFQAAAAVIGLAFLEMQFSSDTVAPWGNRDPNAAPQGIYACGGGDRWCSISCPDDGNASWKALAAVMGRPELIEDPRFATFADRQANHDALDEEITAWTRTRSAHQVMYACQRANVAAGAVATGEDLYRDPQLRSRGYIVEVNHTVPGRLEHPGMTVNFSDSPGAIRRGAPTPGQHTREVLAEVLSLSEAELDQYAASGALS